MIEERRRLPESVGGLVAAALRAYRRRLGLYLGVTVVGLGIEALLPFAARPLGSVLGLPIGADDLGLEIAAASVVDAAISAVVAIGVVADTAGDPSTTSVTIARSALDRWGLVTAVTAFVEIFESFTYGTIFGTPEETGYYVLGFLVAVLWGALSFACIIAATDRKTPEPLLALSALGRAITVAFGRRNLGRLVTLSLVALAPTVVELLLTTQLHAHHVANWEFLGNTPIDAFTTGPLVAVFAVFFFDFCRRSETTSRSG